MRAKDRAPTTGLALTVPLTSRQILLISLLFSLVVLATFTRFWRLGTPNEVYFRLRPANREPRIEPRNRWPRKSPCARPVTLIAGQPGHRFTLEVDFLDSRRHLPILSLKRAA